MESPSFFGLVIISVLVASFSNGAFSSPSPQPLDSEYYYKFMSSISLGYNDPCSWEASQYLLRRNDDMDKYPENSNEYNSIFNEFVKTTVDNDMKYCVRANMLTCSKHTKTCICGDPYMEQTLKTQYNATDYVLEQDKTTGQPICRWARNTFCFPSNATSNLDTNKCGQGSHCVSALSGRACTDEVISTSMKNYVRTGHSFAEWKKTLFTGKVCNCGDLKGKIFFQREKRMAVPDFDLEGIPKGDPFASSKNLLEYHFNY